MDYMAPWLDQPPYPGPKRKVTRLARLSQVLIIAAAIGLVGFLAALITAIVTAGSG